MQSSKPLFLRMCLSSCNLISYLIAALHYSMVWISLLKLPLCIHNAPGGEYINIRQIWFTRLLRRTLSILIRTSLRNKILQLVDFPTPTCNSGCIITTCHTPWARLLVQWCVANEFALIIVSGIWIQRAKQINKYGKGYTELKHLIRHLRSGGRIIITADAFLDSKNCSVEFFEREYKVSLFPARLARIANVPLIAVVAELRNQTIHIYEGPRFYFKHLISTPKEVMQSLLKYLENEIRKSPAIWSSYAYSSFYFYLFMG